MSYKKLLQFCVLTIVCCQYAVGQSKEKPYAAKLSELQADWERADYFVNSVHFIQTLRNQGTRQTNLFGYYPEDQQVVSELMVSKHGYLYAPHVKIPYTRVVGLNRDYYFELKASETNLQEWKIVQVDRVIHDLDFEKRLEAVVATQSNPIFSLNGTPLKQLLLHEHCQVKSISPDEGLLKLEISFDSSKPYPFKGAAPLESATIWLDPSFSHALRRSICRIKLQAGTSVYESSYGLERVAEKYVAMKSFRQTIDKTPSRSAEVDFQIKDASSEEFRLPRFGLPEPEWLLEKQQGQRRLWMYLAGGAILLAGMGWAIKKRFWRSSHAT